MFGLSGCFRAQQEPTTQIPKHIEYALNTEAWKQNCAMLLYKHVYGNTVYSDFPSALWLWKVCCSIMAVSKSSDNRTAHLSVQHRTRPFGPSGLGQSQSNSVLPIPPTKFPMTYPLPHPSTASDSPVSHLQLGANLQWPINLWDVKGSQRAHLITGRACKLHTNSAWNQDWTWVTRELSMLTLCCPENV